MLDGIPLGSSGRKMAYANLDSDPVAKLLLELLLPEAGAIPVAAPAVGDDENFLGVRIALAAELEPPPSDRVDGEF